MDAVYPQSHNCLHHRQAQLTYKAEVFLPVLVRSFNEGLTFAFALLVRQLSSQ
jgi:hypothetical protein